MGSPPVSQHALRLSHLLAAAARDLGSIVSPALQGEALEIITMLQGTLTRHVAELAGMPSIAGEMIADYTALVDAFQTHRGQLTDNIEEALWGDDFTRLVGLRGQLADEVRLLARADGELTADKSDLLSRAADLEAAWCQAVASETQRLLSPDGGEASARKQSQSVFTAERATAYFRKALDSVDMAVASVRIVPGGRSKTTMFLELEGGGFPSSAVVRQDISAPFIPTQVLDEQPVLISALAAGIPVPRVLHAEAADSDLGPPFLLLERLAGKPMGSPFGFENASVALVEDMARVLARLHSIPPRAVPSLAGAIERSTADLMRARLKVAWDDWAKATQEPSPLIELAFARAMRDCDVLVVEPTLVHADFGPHNLLAAGDKVTAVLDWELACIGDPAEDLAYCKSSVESVMDWDAFLAIYESEGGAAPSKERLELFQLWAQLRNASLTALAMSEFSAGKIGSANGLITYVAMPYFEQQLVGGVAQAYDRLPS